VAVGPWRRGRKQGIFENINVANLRASLKRGELDGGGKGPTIWPKEIRPFSRNTLHAGKKGEFTNLEGGGN